MRASRLELWRDRFARFAAGAAASATFTAASVIRIKWFATHFEAAGVGILGQVLNTQTWLGTASSMVLGVPLAQAVSAAVAAGDDDRLRRSVWTALLLVTSFAGATATVGFLLAPQISLAILGSEQHALLVRISMVGVIGIAYQAVVNGLFAGRSDVRTPLTLALAGGLASVAVTFALVPRAGLAGGVIGAVVALPVGITAALWWHRRRYAPALVPAPRPRLDRTLAGGFLRVSVTFLILALLDQGTLIAIRSHIVRAHGVAANGLIQAALSLTQQLGAFFYAYLAGYAFGRVTAEPDAAGIENYTRRQWTPIMLLAVGIFLTAMVAAGPLLHLFYSHRFDAARSMMDWFMVGEFAKVGMQAWIFGALPLRGAWLVAVIAAPVPLTTAATYALLTMRGGSLLDLPHAYAVSGCVALLLCAAVMGAHGVRMRARDGLVAVLGLAVLAALAWSRS